jgi:hypothetical protein
MSAKVRIDAFAGFSWMIRKKRAYSVRIAFIDDMLRFSIPLGITSIAACLRRSGHEARLFIAGPGLRDTLKSIGNYNPDTAALNIKSFPIATH